MAKTAQKPRKSTKVPPQATVKVPVVYTPALTAALLAERARTHGDFTEHAAITQAIKAAFVSGAAYERMNVVQLEAAEMIAHKLGRIAAGDPAHKDHWDDIAGYARLVSDRLPPA